MTITTRITSFLHRITAYAITPFTRSCGLFMLIFIMGSLINCIGIIAYHNEHLNPINSLILIARAITFSWLAVIIYRSIRTLSVAAAKVYIGITILLLLISSISDIITFTVYNTYFNRDYLAVVMATNTEEISEFLSTYISVDKILLGVTNCGIFILAYSAGVHLQPKISSLTTDKTRKSIFETAFSVILSTSIAICAVCHDKIGARVDLAGKIHAICTTDFGHEIIAKIPPINIDYEKLASAPDEIVIIIGESLSRTHCQLYGYEFNTQPRLSKLADDSSLIVYSSPTAPATHTLEAFKRIAGTWDGDTDKTWYESPTFLQIADTAGYRTCWISNQAKKGVYDNLVTKIAMTANVRHWTNDGSKGENSALLDEELLPLIDELNGSRHPQRRLTVIHLIGSHLDYGKRYPKDRKSFTSADYSAHPTNQRSILADYDNSVLYNDSIVSEIFRRFDSSDAMMIYLSDHGQDIFNSDPDLFGHAIEGNPESERYARMIPFMIYTTPSFRIKHHDLYQKFERDKSEPINTTNLTYLLCDIFGIQFI